MAVITFLSDFGLPDTYVGQVKGAILAIAPGLAIVDLTHQVPPQDLRAGAFLLWSAVEVFPAGSIRLAVVDPGVGSARRALAIQAKRGDLFVGPDNGLLLPAVERLGGVERAIELTVRAYWRDSPSTTFHGRDVFGPAAAHLANGVKLERLGRPITDFSNDAAWPKSHGLTGEVVYIDTYGNLVTNLEAATLPSDFVVTIGSHRVPRADFYAQAPPGALLALVGSAGLLEISARNASATKLTGATLGTSITIDTV